MKRGKVFLVGAGPGDPGLMTLRGVEVLHKADVVIYDALVNEKILKHTNPKALLLFAGKRGGEAAAAVRSVEQTEIEARMIEFANRGKLVVRLKGGDPFVFGRGGEEAEALTRAGIPFEVVSGISSAIAAPAYAGIPVTHRDFASAVAIVTGHGAEDGDPSVDWQALAGIPTVVFLMGVSTLPQIVQRLTAAGRAGTTPAAVIQWGTTPRQKKVVGTLATLPEKAREAGISAPAVTIVGPVVSVQDRLSWFERRPLFGKRILVTRSREQASALSERLEEEGAEVVEIPTIEVRPPTSWAGLDRAIRSIAKYEWLIFTSANGVTFFFDRLWDRGGDLRALAGTKIAVIGPATAEAVEARGVRVEVIAKEFRAEGLVRVLKGRRVRGRRILIARAREAREVLVEDLRRLGARVDLVEAYRSVRPRERVGELKRLIEQGKIDLITFASSSTVENFAKMLGEGAILQEARRIPVASIGPITAATARRLGLNVILQPRRYTIPALVDAVVGYFQ